MMAAQSQASQVYTAPTVKDNVDGNHTTVVSIGVLLLVTIILVEVAGINHSAALAVGFLFASGLFIAGMTHSASLQNITQFPANPQPLQA